MLTAREQARSYAVFYVAVVAVVTAALIGLREDGWLQFLELEAYDQFLRWRADDEPSDAPIVLIGIDNGDIGEFDYPIRDGDMARALQRILAAGPRVVGFDLIRDIDYPPGTDAFHDVLRSDNRIVGIRTLPSTTSPGAKAPEVLVEAGRVALADFPTEPDGVQRRAALYFARGEDDGDWTLALQVAAFYLWPEKVTLGEDPETGFPRLGKATFVPLQSDFGGYRGIDAAGYQFIIDYLHGLAPFPTFNLRQVLDPATDLSALQDQIVFVGMTEKTVKDTFFTPFDQGGAFGGAVYGVELWGHLTGQLLRHANGDTPLTRSPPAWAGWIGILLGALLGGLVGLLLRQPVVLAIVIAGGAAVIGGAAFAAFLKFWWLPVVPVGLAWVAAAASVTAFVAFVERRQGSQLARLFATKLSPEMANEFWRNRDLILAGGKPRPLRLWATVMFIDLKGSVGASEQLDPETLMEWVGRFLDTMAEVVAQYDGVIEKFTGDGLMAVFGIPIPRSDPADVAQDARRAADCALAMAARLEGLNAEWRRRGMPVMTMRAGLDTGEVVGGTVGSAHRLDYTVIGETANNAARLEGYDKESTVAAVVEGGCRILASGETAERLGDGYRVERVGAATLRGRTGQTVIHRLYPDAGPGVGPGGGRGVGPGVGPGVAKEADDATH